MKELTTYSTLMDQYRFEAESWRRLLRFVKDELVFCKNQLTDLLAGDMNDEVLSLAETFQEEFLSHDRIMEYLTTEVMNQTRLLQKAPLQDTEFFIAIKRSQQRLRHEVKEAISLFGALNERYILYLTAQC